MLPMRLVVVSLPAMSSTATKLRISASERAAPSTSASTSAEIRSSVGCARRAAMAWPR